MALAGLVAADFALSRGKVHHGVRVWGVNLSGSAPSAADELLTGGPAALLASPLTVTVAEVGRQIRLTPLDMGFGLDVTETVAEALAQGRSGGPLRAAVERLGLWLRPVDLAPVLHLDAAGWQAACDELALQVEQMAQDARLVLQDEEPKVVAAVTGLVIDREEFELRVRRALLSASGSVACPLRAVQPGVTTEEAVAAMAQARGFFSAAISVRYQDLSVEVTREELLQIAGFLPEGMVGGRPVTVGTETGRALLSQKLAVFERRPIDAQVVPSADGRSYAVIPSQDGIAVDWEKLVRAIDDLALTRNHPYVPLPVIVTHPQLTSLDAELLKDRLPVASFTTYFSPANAARVNNIRQVAQLLDGRVIRPGETFSFNEAVGPRTRAAGFDEAPVISNGVLTQGVGGGICQVSTTLFNAALLAGLPITERAPHSFYIERYPVGRDATVSYGTQDLRFTNDTDNLLILNLEAGEDYVLATFSATRWDRRGVCEEAEISSVRPPQSTAEHPRIYLDPALGPGERSEVEEGIDGRTVSLTRRVYSEGGALLWEDSFVSEYAPKDWLVRVGS